MGRRQIEPNKEYNTKQKTRPVATPTTCTCTRIRPIPSSHAHPLTLIFLPRDLLHRHPLPCPAKDFGPAVPRREVAEVRFDLFLGVAELVGRSVGWGEGMGEGAEDVAAVVPCVDCLGRKRREEGGRGGKRRKRRKMEGAGKEPGRNGAGEGAIVRERE